MNPTRRALIALPDAAAAGLYLWCWIAPLALHQYMVALLALALLIEFVVIPAGPFLARVIYGEAMGLQRPQRLKLAAVLASTYILLAGLAAASFDAWFPSFILAWLLGMKVYAVVLGHDRNNSRRESEKAISMLSFAYYFSAIFATMLLPVPMLGITEDGALYGLTGRDEWSNFPYEAVAAGFLYFCALALTRPFGSGLSLGLSKRNVPGNSSGSSGASTT